MHFCLHTQLLRQAQVPSQFLNAYNIDKYNPYKIASKIHIKTFTL